jgi:hypothetical protein
MTQESHRAHNAVEASYIARPPWQAADDQGQWDDLRKNGPFVEFSLCLSRACLGKMFAFMHKWLKKTVFTHRLCNASSEESHAR